MSHILWIRCLQSCFALTETHSYEYFQSGKESGTKLHERREVSAVVRWPNHTSIQKDLLFDVEDQHSGVKATTVSGVTDKKRGLKIIVGVLQTGNIEPFW